MAFDYESRITDRRPTKSGSETASPGAMLQERLLQAGKCGLTGLGSGPRVGRFVQDILPPVGRPRVTAIVRRSKSLDLDAHGKDP